MAFPWMAAAMVVGKGIDAYGKSRASRKRGLSTRGNIDALNRQKGQYSGRYSDLIGQMNQGYMDYIGGIGENIKRFEEGYETLDVDRSGIEAMVGDARQYKTEARLDAASAGYGRAAGEDIYREEARRTTANVLGQAKNIAGSSSDLLGSLAMAQANENAAMRQIDAQSAAQNAAERQAAQSRYGQAQGQMQGAMANAASFNLTADQAENASRNARLSGLMDLYGARNEAQLQKQIAWNRGHHGLMDMEMGFDQAVLAQKGVVGELKAQQTMATAGMFGDMINAAGMYMGQQNQMNAMGNYMGGYGGGFGGGWNPSTGYLGLNTNTSPGVYGFGG